MITEHTDNAAYMRWIYRNPAAFIINLNTNGKFQSVVHTARCGHLYEPTPTLDHVSTYGKVSSESLTDLVRWAEERGHTVVECTTCLPYDRK